MILSKNNFLSIEKIIGTIKLNSDVKDGDYELEIKICKVYDWYDEAI